MSRTPKIIGPVDQNAKPIHRSMGMPILRNTYRLSSASEYAILYDFSAEAFSTRVFQGMSFENASASSRIYLAWVESLMDTPIEFGDIGPQQFFTLDWMQFGPGVIDDTQEKRVRYLLAKLDIAQGTLATGTIDYSASLQPADQETVVINGLIYEFSNDASKNTSSNYLVEIKGTADLTWTELKDRLNATQRYVTATINTGTDIVTLTANPGGVTGDLITTVDGSTGAVFSGATLAGGAGGVIPYSHVW